MYTVEIQSVKYTSTFEIYNANNMWIGPHESVITIYVTDSSELKEALEKMIDVTCPDFKMSTGPSFRDPRITPMSLMHALLQLKDMVQGGSRFNIYGLI